MTLVIGAANVFGGILGTLTIERFGRKFNMKYGALVQAISFAILNAGIFFKNAWLPMIAVILYMLAFAIGFGGTMMMFCAEIIPPVGLGIAIALQFSAASLIGWAVPHLEDVVGAVGFIYIFIACNFAAFLYV